jgi:hypothetical protein
VKEVQSLSENLRFMLRFYPQALPRVQRAQAAFEDLHHLIN